MFKLLAAAKKVSGVESAAVQRVVAGDLPLLQIEAILTNRTLS